MGNGETQSIPRFCNPTPRPRLSGLEPSKPMQLLRLLEKSPDRCSWGHDRQCRVCRLPSPLSPKKGVTPVLVTGVHFSTKRDARGTMDTGDKRRYDSFVCCSRPCAKANAGLTGQQCPQAKSACLPATAGPIDRSKARPGVTMKMCLLSVDFEDYAHDLQRLLGVSRPRRTPRSLTKGYELLDEFCRSQLDGARLTFFTTGQVAREYPEIVRRIAEDGHEIACHYNEHDNIAEQDRVVFRRNLEIALEALSKASGQTIKGFRAPDFSIDESCSDWAYEELSKYFVYDSSYVTNVLKDRAHSTQNFEFATGTQLHEFAIYQRKLFPGVNVRVMGGTYLRFLPSGTVQSYLAESWQKGFIPHIYIHPYDYLTGYEQWSRWRDLKELSPYRRIYWWLRQHQWHSIGNRSVFKKIARVYDEYRCPGTLAKWIEAHQIAA